MTYADFGLGDVALVKGFVLEELVAYQTTAQLSGILLCVDV